jgi:hypothetical protein
MPLNDVRRIQRRARQAERDVGHWLLRNDGPDPVWAKITSSTARVGHITGLQFDVVSLHYCAEVKNIKMSARLQSFWKQIQEMSARHGKDALLVIQPSNPVDKNSTWHVITPERHAELLAAERDLHAIRYVELPRSTDG